MNVGDRVRCTLGDNILVGKVLRMAGPSAVIGIEGSFADITLDHTVWTVEVITPELPPEPPIGSVVRDGSGAIWVHVDAVWKVTGDPALYYWPEICLNGPLTLLIPATQVIEDLLALARHTMRDSLVDALAEKYGVTL